MRLVRLVKALEHVRQIFRRDARACVAHAHADQSFLRAIAHDQINRAALGRVLHGVVENRHQHLLRAVGVAFDHGKRLRHVEIERFVDVVGILRIRFVHGLEHSHGIKRMLFQRTAAGLQARELEHVVDQT